MGYKKVGEGGARYVLSSKTGATLYRAQLADGRWFELSEPQIFVEMFGAIGGDAAHDDQPAIQAAIDYNEEYRSGVVWCVSGRVYYLSKTITVNPTRTSIEGLSAIWDFRLMPVEAMDRPKVPEKGPATDADRQAACVLICDPPSPQGTQYGQDSHYCRGLKVIGPASQPASADGFYFDTATAAFSSRWTFYNVEAVQNLARGLVLRNRSYLAKFYACAFGGAEAGVEFIRGEDAGENFSFFGGFMGSNGGAALKNNGGEFYLFGVSMDFPKSFIDQSAGQTHCFGCHFETNPGALSTRRPFDIGGELYINGGQIMGGAALDGSPIPYDCFFHTRTNTSRVILSNVWGYNWQGGDHVICGGPGRIVIDRLLGGWNWNIPGIIKRDAIHSLAGKAGLFEDKEANLDLWVSGQGAPTRESRARVVWDGHDHAAAAAPATRFLSAERSDKAAHSGSGSLAIVKAGFGHGSGADVSVLIAFPPGGGHLRSCEFWVKPVVAQPSALTAPLFTQLLWASVIGRDGFGVPQFGETHYTGEAKLTVDCSRTDHPWSRLAYGDPIYTDPSDPLGGYAPAWATHLLLRINLVSLPPMTLYLDDLHVFAV